MSNPTLKKSIKAGFQKLWESSVFQYGFWFILLPSAGAAYAGKLTWEIWLSQAIVILGIYATKEGVRYGSDAYKSAYGEDYE